MGTFQPAIGYRIPYDADGSTGFYFNSGTSTPSVYTSGHLVQMNNESTDVPASVHRTTRIHGLVFSHLWDINGIYINMYMQHSSKSFYSLQTSPDSTNGIDGSWSTQLANPPYDGDASSNGYWRSGADTIAPLLNVKAIRFYAYNHDNHGVRTLHLYGKPTAGENPDRVIFWKSSMDDDAQLLPEDLDPGDEGDVTRGLNYDKYFRIKNNSSTMTANSIDISCEILTDTTPSVPSQFKFSYQGSPYASSVTIPSLLPGSLSDDITVRYEVDPSANTVARSPRLRATPGSFS